GIVRQHVEVADGCEDPVDPDRARFLGRDRAGPPHDRRVAERGEGKRRRELGQAYHLLPGATLEVGGDEERTAGPSQQVRGEAADRLDRTPEDDEGAHTERKST